MGDSKINNPKPADKMKTISLPPPSVPLQKCLSTIASSNFKYFFNRGMAKLEEASLEVDAIAGDQREKNRDLNHLFLCYADHKMLRAVPVLATHIARFYGLDNLDSDFRTTGVKDLPNSPPELLNQLGDLISYEQAVIRAAGLVNPDGTVTLFRNCGKEQVDALTQTGRGYQGSNVESWTIRPDMNWGGTKITANIPLKYCIASCIGRKGHPFKHPGQSEITVCGTFVKKVQTITAENLKTTKETAICNLRKNIQRRLSTASTRNRKAARISKFQLNHIKNALFSLANDVLKGKNLRDDVYYGQCSIIGQYGKEAGERRSIMAGNKKEAIRIGDNPLLYFMRKTHSLWKAIKLTEKWEMDHGIELGPAINANTPEEGAFQERMQRWTDFVTSRGYDIGGEPKAVYQRLWKEFIAAERQRNQPPS